MGVHLKESGRSTDNKSMDLSATELLEDCERPDERRRAPRQTFITKGMIYREDGQAGPRRIALKNLSALGVGFESAAPIEPGTRCRIRIEAGPTQIDWRLQVVCCGRIDGGDYRLGGQFVPAPLERQTPPAPQPWSAALDADLMIALPPEPLRIGPVRPAMDESPMIIPPPAHPRDESPSEAAADDRKHDAPHPAQIIEVPRTAAPQPIPVAAAPATAPRTAAHSSSSARAASRAKPPASKRRNSKAKKAESSNFIL